MRVKSRAAADQDRIVFEGLGKSALRVGATSERAAAAGRGGRIIAEVELGGNA